MFQTHTIWLSIEPLYNLNGVSEELPLDQHSGSYFVYIMQHPPYFVDTLVNSKTI